MSVYMDNWIVFLNQVCIWFLKFFCPQMLVYICVCVFVCPHPEGINNKSREK